MPFGAACGGGARLIRGVSTAAQIGCCSELLRLGLRARASRLFASQRMLAGIGLMRRLVDFPTVDAVFLRSVFVGPR